jgi:hypothetical protein
MLTFSSDRSAPALRRNRPFRVGIDARPVAERPCGFGRSLEIVLPVLPVSGSIRRSALDAVAFVTGTPAVVVLAIRRADAAAFVRP